MLEKVTGPVFRPFYSAFLAMQCRVILVVLAAFTMPFSVQGHPQDEDIVLDIEQGEMQLQAGQIDEEYIAALKRKRLRKLAAMSWQEKFQLYVVAGF